MRDPASEPIAGTESPEESAAITLDDVWVRFGKPADPVIAARELTLRIPRGKIFCLLGPNGSGKTTAINLISGLLSPSQGQVRVFGHTPDKDRTRTLSKIAVVPQETTLYDSLDARENLFFHGHYYGVDSARLPGLVDHVIDLVQLTDRAKHRVGTYSGGMQRRLTLARALLTEPEALLLDEPTLGVDVQSRRALWDRIRELADGGMSVLLTTNYMEEAEELADYITILDHGRKVVDGTLDELRARVAEQRLLLHFDAADVADQAAASLSRASRPGGEADATVEVALNDPKEAMRVVSSLRENGSLGDRLEGFEWSEPNLQDVFLQFTGRALRD
ncbi:ABC transporter ATP-binding protein [Streptomyces sulphureus]|uniref:ABC transporter ATP-binding protein n=1 Tax=Streptomyces sulphureus TaxID=47758 RepID=UPI00037D1198|nr:ABC transporter ATP-binding protein [Streptomyces sulphureus]